MNSGHRLPARLDDTVFPTRMGDDERAVRQALYLAWMESAEAFRLALLIAADWFEERGHPDWAVCRAEWVPRMNRNANPGRWWKWQVRPPVPTGWDVRAAVKKTASYNRTFWLCWPPDWVRFTGGYALREGFSPAHIGPRGEEFTTGEFVTVPDAWCVSVQPHSTFYNLSAEGRLGRLGWTALFHPPETMFPAVEPKRAVVGTTLFDGLE